MLHTIQNGRMRVTADSLGAQLWSILGHDAAEYLWQGDQKYWADRALTIFPYVARLWQGKYELDGQVRSMPIHGFAPGSEFALAEKTDTQMVFELSDSGETFARYPRRFSFRVTYALCENTLAVTYEVINRDERTMHFGLGGHPGFNVPLEEGRAFEDYRLRFSAPCEPVRVGFTPDCFVSGEDKLYPLEDGTTLPLRHDLFDDDAIVLRAMAREVTLEDKAGGHFVKISYPDMPYLGIWHWPKTDAPYVCIEPWRSLPSRHGRMAVLEEQEDLVHLPAGETYQNRWTIEIG